MNKKLNTGFLVMGTLLLLIGFVVLYNATNFGIMMAENANISTGGMNSEQYSWMMKSSTISFQIFGAIFSVLGGFSAILAGYKLNEK